MAEAMTPAGRTYQLAAQIPAISPDETASLVTMRELSAEEAVQLAADTSLVRSTARSAPYQRATVAYEQLFTAADAVQTTQDHRPTARGAAILDKGLSAVAHVFRELPAAIAKTLSENLADDADATDRLALASDALQRGVAFRLTTQLDVLEADQLLIAREDVGFEVVATGDAAVSWVGAAKIEETSDVLGVLRTVEEALDAAAKLVARSLVEQREILDAACKRISALDGEVFRGASCALELIPSDDGSTLKLRNLSPLPVGEVSTVQYAIARAEALLGSSEREPATRGPRAISSETIAAIIAAQRDESPPAPSSERDEPAAGDRPMDMAAVIGHLQLGALRLEQAWSRALAKEDVATLAGEWASLQQALIGELQHLDDALPEEDRHLELPPTIEEILDLIADVNQSIDRRRRVAQVMAISDLVALIPTLSEPTNSLNDGTARRVEWFSSGAFANVRGQLGLVEALLKGSGAEETMLASGRLATQARLRADPLAEVIHLARAFRDLPEAALPLDGTYERAVVEHVYAFARQIGAGDPVEAGHAILCAVVARDVLDGVRAR